MKTTSGKFRSSITTLRQGSVAEIKDVFDKWVCLPKGFGNPARIRLFSPLKHLLALPLTGALCRHLMQGNLERVPRMVGQR